MTSRAGPSATLRAELAELVARVERLERASTVDADRALGEIVERIAARCDALIDVSDAIYGELFDRLDRLEADLAEVRRQHAERPAPTDPTSGGTLAYGDIVPLIRARIVELTPPGATVAVVGKGDPALIDLEGRFGWHFPRQADGKYLGFYPRTDADAVTMLDEVRTAGAEYLVFPATSLWWLEHYRGLAQHLHDHHHVVVREADICAIYRLERAQAVMGTSQPPVTSDVHQVRDLVDRLVPAGEPVAVAASDLAPYHALLRDVVALPPTDDAAAVERAVGELFATGIRYVIVPHVRSGRSTMLDHLLAGATDVVIDQRQVCAVLSINERTRSADGPLAVPLQGA